MVRDAFGVLAHAHRRQRIGYTLANLFGRQALVDRPLGYIVEDGGRK
jgi:hypothetical protein